MFSPLSAASGVDPRLDIITCVSSRCSYIFVRSDGGYTRALRRHHCRCRRARPLRCAHLSVKRTVSLTSDYREQVKRWWRMGKRTALSRPACQQPQGYYEFTDFPILETGLEDMGVRERGILSGEALYTYIYKYAEHFDLLRRTRLNTKIMRATNNELDATKAGHSSSPMLIVKLRRRRASSLVPN